MQNELLQSPSSLTWLAWLLLMWLTTTAWSLSS